MVTKKTVKKIKPAVKKKVVKEKAPVVEEKMTTEKESNIAEKYFYAVGKRKTSIAQVKLYPVKTKETSIEVNNKKIDAYFNLERLCNAVKAPLGVLGGRNFFISVNVCGGGTTGQAEAIRLGIARAIVKMEEELKKSLKDLGFLTRDARIVERKKPGKRKARRSPQWAKR